MKRTVALILLIASIFSLASCSPLVAYNLDDVLFILEWGGYTVENVDIESEEGIVGYIYGEKSDTEDEIYFIYCDDFDSARTLYKYVKNKHKARISELEMEIEKIEFALYKSEGVSAAEKGKYYESYILKTEELERCKDYEYGRYHNVVWYGTESAIYTMITW